MARYGKARKFEFEGVTGTANEHADRLGVKPMIIYNRVHKMGRGVMGRSTPRKPRKGGWKRSELRDFICSECGRPFQSRFGQKKTCSKACLQKRTASLKPKVKPKVFQNECPICLCLFETIYKQKIFCSIPCRVFSLKASKPKSIVPPKLRECPCGKQFQIVSLSQKFCCISCRKKLSVRSPRKKRVVTPRHCKKCGKSFFPARNNQFYCTGKCRTNGRKHRPKLRVGLVSHASDCPCCGNPLPIPRQRNKKFCTRICMNRGIGFVGMTGKPGWCKVCSKPLKIPRQPKSLYCSRRCAVKVHRIIRDNKPSQKLKNSLSKALRGALRKRHGNYPKNNSILKYTGCTLREVMLHLEKQFDEGMNWSNRSTFGWHVDHIIPLARFDLTREDHRHVALHFTNLRPLWWRENTDKSDKIVHTAIDDDLYLRASMIGVCFEG